MPSESAGNPDLYVDAGIVICSDPRLLCVLRNAIGNLTLQMGWSESDSRGITLAVEEALTNKIRHAYGGRSDGRIRVEFRTEPGALVFRLTDQGKAPDPGSLCARLRESLTPGGLGTHIIRDVMDEVSYRTNEEGNQVILKKYLPGKRVTETSIRETSL